jgi:membrane protein implicated in regulation of membrane protease activity
MGLFNLAFYWSLLGLSFMVAELFIPGFFFGLSLSASSFLTALYSYTSSNLSGCVLLFIILTPLCFCILHFLNKRYNTDVTYKSNLEENLLHMHTIIRNKTTQDIPKIIHHQIVWSVKEKDNKELYHHDKVRTLYIKGNSFVVTKIN